MFDQISGRYDILNRLMTFGLDQMVRRKAVKLLCKEIPLNAQVLDSGCGTGDLSLQIARLRPDIQVIACDFSTGMVRLGLKKTAGRKIHYVIADAQYLPFRSDALQGSIAGFLLRNVPDIRGVLVELRRVLTPSAPAVWLDTTPPDFKKGGLLIRFYYRVWIPRLGRILTGNRDAYRYLIDSTAGFLQPAALVDLLARCGFSPTRWSIHAFKSLAVFSSTNQKNLASNNPADNKTL